MGVTAGGCGHMLLLAVWVPVSNMTDNHSDVGTCFCGHFNVFFCFSNSVVAGLSEHLDEDICRCYFHCKLGKWLEFYITLNLYVVMQLQLQWCSGRGL